MGSRWTSSVGLGLSPLRTLLEPPASLTPPPSLVPRMGSLVLPGEGGGGDGRDETCCHKSTLMSFQ